MKQNLLKTWLMLVCLLVGAGSAWAENYATWTFASGTAGTNYPANKTNFAATSGSCSESVFYLNGSGSTWNSTKGYAFTAVTDMTVTLKLTADLAAGSNVVFAADMYYNKDSNAPMTGFKLSVSVNDGSYVTTGLSATSLSLSNSSANKSVTYTTQTALKSGDQITLKYTQTGKAGTGQGYVGNITIDGPTLTSGSGGSDPTPTKYNVTISKDIQNGTVKASPTSAEANATVTLTATPSTGYEFSAWDVKDASNNAITVTDNKFTMPAANVNVSATFKAIGGGEPTGDEKTGTIKFGTNDIKINNTTVYGDDDLGNTWTITTKTSANSFTSNESYYQVGSSNKPATSITFTTTLPKDVTINKMSAKFGGFSGTAGTVTLKVGSSAIGTGSLNEANDVTVNSTSTAKGKVLTVTLTNIAKGVKVYNISYTYSDEGGGSDPIGDPEISNLIKTSTLIVETGAEPYDVRNLLNIPNDYDGTITTTIEDLTEKDGEFSCVYPNLSFQTSGTYTVNVTAAAIPGKYAETTGNIIVTAKKPIPNYDGAYVDYDLSKDITTSATKEEMTWIDNVVNIEAAKAESSIDVNNYYPGSSTPRTSTRFYANSTLTFTPTASVTITGIKFTTTSNAYTTVLETSNWTNADVIADTENKIAYVTPIDGTSPISVTIGGTTGVTNIRVYYSGTPSPYTTKHLTLKAHADDGYYATFSSDKVTFFPEDYVVSAVGVENGKLYKFSNDETFDDDIVEINGKDVIGYYVPANTGVLLYSTDENVIYQNVTGVTPSDEVKAVNMLVPTTADGIFKAEADGNYYYKLAYGDNTNKTKLGFWFGAEDGSGNFNVKAGGAVLRVPQIAGVKGFSLSGGDETAIENLMSNNKQKTIYNLQGVKLQKLQKGVNIVNGRKVIR